jgi:Subtilase family/Methyltransferase domain/Divergent InlB B-repeat domain/Fibronectin type III domain
MAKNEYHEIISRYYGRSDTARRLLDVLRQAGINNPDTVTARDLAPFDNLHARGRAGTIDLAKRAGFMPGSRVLDIGGGIGGPARTLATEFGCVVIVLDLTEEFCEFGRMLTALTKLSHAVSFQLGNALAAPFTDGSFDAVWMQGSGMNIPQPGVEELRDAINYVWNRNIVLVAAAGNDGDTSKRWPAACPNVLSVAATNQDDTRRNTSSFGTWVELAAPGTDIWSTAVPNADKCQTDIAGAFAKCSGTSMAAPHVAVLAALVQKSCAPITAQGVVNRITSTADRIPGTGTLWQYRRINALNAVCWPKPVNLHVVQQQTNSIRVGWTDMTPGGTRFDIKYRVSGSGDTWLTEQGAASDTIGYIGSLTPGTSYDFKVQECDGAVCSEFSNQVTAKALDLFKLSVSVGAGAGKVTSNPAGVSCGNGSTDCSEFYAPGTLVKLSAAPVFGYTFDHWEGSCTGTTALCSVSMTAARTAKAYFVKSSEPVPPQCPPTLPNCQEQ